MIWFLCSIADKCRKKQYQARRADEQSTELYFAAYIGLHGPIVEKAVVMDVKDLSFDVIVLSTGKVQKIYTDVSTVQVQ
jgi:exoribonuclease R